MKLENLEKSSITDINYYLSKFYKVIWIPLHLLIFYLVAYHLYMYAHLWMEFSEKEQGRTLLAICIYLTFNFTSLFVLIKCKSNPGRILEQKFDPIDKRFTKEELNRMSQSMKGLLSCSHLTQQDIMKTLDTEGNTSTKKCLKCNDLKPLSMSHCSTCDKCVYKLDHHCPWLNRCIAHNNLRFFISLLVFGTTVCFCNGVLIFTSRYSDYYSENLWKCRILTYLSFLSTYGLAPYTLLEVYINAKGRTFLELLAGINKKKAKPKFKYGENWREHFYLFQGTWWPILGIIFPYFLKSPVTGLEYSFVKNDNEPDNFIENTFEPLFRVTKKSNNQT
ncbi:unnamed protein product [Moneuplotes crassus]|uniref:Palmitoyltransferase n=1 Tax=Euplotes crassus TaxID=5936 RepID=A0AAD1XMW7_EUPCR|nr:unnamed protein product [Moneuplotes crassus]